MEHLSVLLYDYVEDIAERRGPHRPAHLALLNDVHASGDCVMGGALGDPPHGGLIVFRSAEAAERFVGQDPYVAAGLVKAHRIVPWTVVVP
jgi:uncharacterized protein YciI